MFSLSFSLRSISAAISQAYAGCRSLEGGKNADYIPFLADIDPSLFAVAAVTTSGMSVSEGDTDVEFALESISKVFTAAGAMRTVGVSTFVEAVGSEPTGLPFNSVMALELHGDRPQSPMVNAGALSATALLHGEGESNWFGTIRRLQDGFAGSPVGFSEKLYLSEAETNAHNKAIAWLLASGGNLAADPDTTVDVYTRGCSTLVTITQLATMAATIANAGVNPLTGETVMDADVCPPLMAEMMMEGLYEQSGHWALNVGLPAKSGVGGGLMAVVPGVMGLAAFSPPLNSAGNSVKAVAALTHVAHNLGLGLFNCTPQGHTPKQ